MDDNCTVSEIYVKSHTQEIKIQKRNVKFCSVFSCKLIAIDQRFDFISSLPPTKEICILTDSKNAAQQLANWHNVRCFTSISILKKLKNLSRSHLIHLQWIPSHVDISGNEAADSLVKAGSSEAAVSLVTLIFSELFSIT